MKKHADSHARTALGTCASCGTPLLGKHCYACGEKKIDAKDYSLRKYLEQSVDIFTHFDTKFFRSFRDLLFAPGKLTIEYLAGRRVKYMKPLQLYILVSLLFFFFFKDVDLFFHRARYVVLERRTATGRFEPVREQNLRGYQLALKQALVAASEKKGMTLEAYVTYFDDKLPERSRAFIFLMIPLTGLALYLLYFRRNRYFVPHLVHATHLFSFFLTIATLVLLIYRYGILPLSAVENFKVVLIPILLTFLAYLFVSLRRVYGQALGWTVLRTGLMAGALFVIFLIYHELILWVNYLLV